MKLTQKGNGPHTSVWRSRAGPLALVVVMAASLLAAGTALAADGDLIRVTSDGGNGHDFGNGIAALPTPDGGAIITGRFDSTVTFGETDPLTSLGGSDICVVKYDADGNVLWASQAGGTESDAGNGIAALPDGGAVVAGRLQRVVGTGGIDDVFVARYNAGGTQVWARQDGGSDFDMGYAVAALADGSAIVTGQFQSADAMFGGIPLTPAGAGPAYSRDIFVAKYDADGNVIWARRGGGIDSDEGFGVATASDGSVLVTGYFEGTATFEVGDGTTKEPTPFGAHDVFVAKYNSDGILQWVTSAGGTGIDEGTGIAALEDGSALVSWHSRDTASSPDDVFVAKYNSDGTLAWVTQAGGVSSDAAPAGIAALSDSSVVVAGRFDGIATFGAGELNETTLTSDGSYDVFLAQYNPDGTLAWVTQAGGTGWDEGLAVSALSEGNAFVTGDFQGTATFDGGTLTSVSGTLDIFVAEYEASPSVGELEVDIDIRPGAGPNVVNLGSHGVIPVAILSSLDFDATQVDPATVVLAGSSVAIRGRADRLMAHEEDVNADGLLDLVVQVETENLNPEEFQNGYAELTGETYDGVAIVGRAEITIVPGE